MAKIKTTKVANSEAGAAQNAYREEDWEEGPPRTDPSESEALPARHVGLEQSKCTDIGAVHAAMLAELIGQSHEFAMDYFETARGIDDRVTARARKVAMACKLSSLTMQLIAAADRHKKDSAGS